MKELEAISINEGAVLTEHGLKPNGEVILIYSEPVYHSGGEEAVKKRHTNCLRLGMSPERMEQFAKNLLRSAEVMRENFAQALRKTSAARAK